MVCFCILLLLCTIITIAVPMFRSEPPLAPAASEPLNPATATTTTTITNYGAVTTTTTTIRVVPIQMMMMVK